MATEKRLIFRASPLLLPATQTNSFILFCLSWVIKKKIDSNASGFFLLGTLVCGEGEWGSETTLKGRAIRKLSHLFSVLYDQQSARAAGDVLVLGSRWYYKESLMQVAGLLGERNRGRREKGAKKEATERARTKESLRELKGLFRLWQWQNTANSGDGG